MTNRLSSCQNFDSFETLIHYLSTEEKEFLTSKIANLVQNESFYNELAKKMTNGEWLSLFSEVDQELFPWQALKCIKEQKISMTSFATSQLFFNVWNHPDNAGKARLVAIFPTGKRSGNASTMISATMKIAFSAFLELQQKVYGKDFSGHKNLNEKIWSTEDEKNFYKILWHAPASEHHFLIVEDTSFQTYLKTGRDYDRSVMDEINLKFGINPLCRLKVGKVFMRMIPSRGMMQAYIEAVYASNAPKPVYRFGLSSVKGLLETLHNNGKDMFQSFKYLPTPSEADSFRAEQKTAEMEMHDFYHYLRIVDIPHAHRDLLIQLAFHFFEKAKTNSVFGKQAENFATYITDMEHSAYYKHNSNTLHSNLFNEGEQLFPDINKFCATLDMCFKRTLNEINKENTTKALFLISEVAKFVISIEENFEAVFQILMSGKAIPGNFSMTFRMVIEKKLEEELESLSLESLLRRCFEIFIRNQKASFTDCYYASGCGNPYHSPLGKRISSLIEQDKNSAVRIFKQPQYKEMAAFFLEPVHNLL